MDTNPLPPEFDAYFEAFHADEGHDPLHTELTNNQSHDLRSRRQEALDEPAHHSYYQPGMDSEDWPTPGLMHDTSSEMSPQTSRTWASGPTDSSSLYISPSLLVHSSTPTPSSSYINTNTPDSPFHPIGQLTPPVQPTRLPSPSQEERAPKARDDAKHRNRPKDSRFVC